MKKSICILFILCINSYLVFAQSPKVGSAKPITNKSLIENNKFLNKQSIKDKEVVEFQDFSKDDLEKKPERDFGKYLNSPYKSKETNALVSKENITEEKKAKPKKKEIAHKYEVSFNFTNESLSNNFGIWRTASLYAKRKSEDGKILWGEYRVSQRRVLRDKEVVFGIYQPLKKRFAFTVESSVSNTNKFVAKYSIRAEGEKVFKDGWVGHVGYWYKFYDPVKVKVLYGEVEKYWGNNRVAYKLNLNNVSNAGTSPSNTITYNRYYGERINTWGVRLGFGEEEEFVEESLGVLKTNTIGVTGSFKHWVTNSVGLAIDATLHKQGEFYYNRGLNLGVRYRF